MNNISQIDPAAADKRLVKQILKGDSKAFRTMFDRVFPRLYRFALARVEGDAQVAGDMVQLTFRKAIERLETWRGEAALYSWFCQICRNTIIDWQRSQNRERANVVPLEDLENVRALLDAMTAPVADQPETAAWQRDMQRLVQATVDVLPQKYGDVLEWKYVDGDSVNEIAERLDLGVKATESLLTRARNRFKQAIGELVDNESALAPPQR